MDYVHTSYSHFSENFFPCVCVCVFAFFCLFVLYVRVPLFQFNVSRLVRVYSVLLSYPVRRHGMALSATLPHYKVESVVVL